MLDNTTGDYEFESEIVMFNECKPEATEKIPKFRGISHLIAFPFSVIFGSALVLSANDVKSKLSALVFAVSLSILFGVSAMFHRSDVTYKHRTLLHRLDLSAIYILIAGTYTSLLILTQETSVVKPFTFIWCGAMLGILRTFLLPRHRTLTLSSYFILTWSIVPFGKDVIQAVDSTTASLVIAGGLCYKTGGIIFAFKWPNPLQDTFGYHEIFHIFVIIASAIHFLALRSMIKSNDS